MDLRSNLQKLVILCLGLGLVACDSPETASDLTFEIPVPDMEPSFEAYPHPMLFFSHSRIPILQLRALSASFSQWSSDLAQAASESYEQFTPNPAQMPNKDEDWRHFGDRLPQLAAQYLINGDPLYLGRTKQWLEIFSNLPNWGAGSNTINCGIGSAHVLTGFSIAYDLLFPALSTQEIERYQSKIFVQGQKFYECITDPDPQWWVKSYIQNHNHTNFIAFLIAGLVLKEDFTVTHEWIELAVENFETVVFLHNLQSPGGAESHEGLAYASLTHRAVVLYDRLVKQHQIPALVWSREVHQSIVNQYLNGFVPGFLHHLSFGDTKTGFYQGPSFILHYLDGINRDGVGNWLAKTHQDKQREAQGELNGSEKANLFYDFLFYDPSVLPTSPQGLPLTRVYSDWGVATYRQSWDLRGASHFLAMKAGSPGGETVSDLILNQPGPFGPHAVDFDYSNANLNHEHPENGNFLYYISGKPFLTGSVRNIPTSANPGFKQLSKYENIHTFYSANHCQGLSYTEMGQQGEPLTSVADRFPEGELDSPGKNIITEKSRAHLIKAGDSSGVAYFSAELAEAYPECLKLQRYYRNLVLLPNGALVLIDQIKTDPGFTFTTRQYFRTIMELTGGGVFSSPESFSLPILFQSPSLAARIQRVLPLSTTVQVGTESMYEATSAYAVIQNPLQRDTVHSANVLFGSDLQLVGSPSLVYSTPSSQNPDGITLTLKLKNTGQSDLQAVTYTIRIAMNLANQSAFFGGQNIHCRVQSDQGLFAEIE